MLSSLLVGSGMFFIAFMLHVNMRKTIYAKPEIFSIFLSFILISIIFLLLLLLCKLKLIQYLFDFKSIDLENAIFSYLLYVVVFCSYAMTYLEISSKRPSFEILKLLKHKGPLRKQEIISLLEEKKIINSKVESLQLEKVISVENNCFKLNKIGVLVIKFFIFFRSILGQVE